MDIEKDNITELEIGEFDDYAPDMTIDGKDLWEHYHFVVDKSQLINFL